MHKIVVVGENILLRFPSTMQQSLEGTIRMELIPYSINTKGMRVVHLNVRVYDSFIGVGYSWGKPKHVARLPNFIKTEIE